MIQKTSQWLTIPIDGGLDFMSAKPFVNPGSLIDCENYEVAIRKGVSRFEGYEAFDGGASPTFEIRNNILVFGGFFGGDVSGFFNVNDPVVVQNLQGDQASGIVVSKDVDTVGGTTSVLCKIILTEELATPYDIALTEDSLHQLTFDSATGSFADVSAQISSASLYWNAIHPTIQAVPGQGPILGLFWFNDKLYAARDLFTGLYQNGALQPNEGDEVFQGASYGAATFKGYVGRFTKLGGDFVGGNAYGFIALYNTTGTATTATLYNHTQSDATLGDLTVASYNGIAAGLYRADGGRGATVSTASWQLQDLGWSVQYQDGEADFVALNTALVNADIASQIVTTDWKVATADDVNIGNHPWATVPSTSPASYYPQLADGSTPDYDNTYVYQSATAVGAMQNTVRVMGFGFTESDIPEGAYVTGIEVEIVKRGYRTGFSAATIVDANMHLLGLGTDTSQGFGDAVTAWTTNTTATDNTPSSWDTVTYGGKQSLLGATNVTADRIWSSDFGVQMGAYLQAKTGTGTAVAHITSVRVRVHYLPQTSKVYFWNGSSAVTADVVQAYIQSGTIAGTDAKGVAYLTNVGSNRVIGGGEQIRTYPANPALSPDGGGSDGSTLIAKTSTYAEKNWMDWGALLNDTSTIDKPKVSKYQYVVNNFFASAGLDAMFIVSGGGPCAYFDGKNFSRILTGLSITAEKPRHVLAHQGRLMLGYYSGNLNVSDINSPLSFDGTLGTGSAAFTLGFGAPITGLAQFNGDTVAVYTSNSVQMLQGNVNDPNGGISQGVIAPKIGSIEYCSASMGQFLFMSFKGLASIESVKEYGDFKDTPISEVVWDWLRPRVQTSAFFESDNSGIQSVLPVKNKGQLRSLFNDGYILTATFLNIGELPQYTIQRYVDADGNPVVMSVVCAGTETTGRDRIFASDGNTDGYVYELDRGATFNGTSYDYVVTLNANDLRIPYQRKQWQTLHLHGMMSDYVSITGRRSKNYEPILASATITYQGGDLANVPTGTLTPFMSMGSSPLQLEGRNLNLKFGNSTIMGEGVHILQAISIMFTPLNEEMI